MRKVVLIYAVWLVVYVMLQNNPNADRDTVEFVGLLPWLGPAAVIVFLTIGSWLATRWEEWRRR